MKNNHPIAHKSSSVNPAMLLNSAIDAIETIGSQFTSSYQLVDVRINDIEGLTSHVFEKLATDLVSSLPDTYLEDEIFTDEFILHRNCFILKITRDGNSILISSDLEDEVPFDF